MKKKIIGAALACVALVNCGLAAGAFEGEMLQDFFNLDRTTLLYETPSVTQADLDSDFRNYAEPEATANMPECFVSTDGSAANAVGIVVDYVTETPICGAEIAINGVSVVQTGSDGRFQITNVPDGVYDWSISAEGYYTAEYLNYSVYEADGASIFTFFISKDFPTVDDYEEIMNDRGSQTIPPMMSESNHENTKAMSTVPTVSNTVNVYYKNAVRSVDRQTYIYTVISSELYNADYYRGKGLTDKEIWQLYFAQGVAANTFLEYTQSVYSNHKSYDVCSSACCQAYNPAKVTQEAIDATKGIFYNVNGSPSTLILLHKPSSHTYNYIWGAFFSSCGDRGTQNYGTSQPALKAVSCTDLTSGAGGHRYGMCQMGAARMAKDGYTANDILMHYYTDCSMEYSKLA